MSRTQIRIVLILLALILVATTILSGLLTWWADTNGSQESVPADRETVQLEPSACGILREAGLGCDGGSREGIGS